MKDQIKLDKITDCRINVRLLNGFFLGTFEPLDDGYFYFYLPSLGGSGAIGANILRELSLKLEEINEPWDRIVAQGLEKLNSVPT